MSGLKGLTKVLSHLSKISYLQTNFHTTIRKPIGLKQGETTCLNITKCRVEVLVLLCISTSTNSHGEVFISQSHASLVPLLHKLLSRGCFSSQRSVQEGNNRGTNLAGTLRHYRHIPNPNISEHGKATRPIQRRNFEEHRVLFTQCHTVAFQLLGNQHIFSLI